MYFKKKILCFIPFSDLVSFSSSILVSIKSTIIFPPKLQLK